MTKGLTFNFSWSRRTGFYFRAMVALLLWGSTLRVAARNHLPALHGVADSQRIEMDSQGVEAEPQGVEAEPQGVEAEPRPFETEPQGVEAGPQGVEAGPQRAQTEPYDLAPGAFPIARSSAPGRADLSRGDAVISEGAVPYSPTADSGAAPQASSPEPTQLEEVEVRAYLEEENLFTLPGAVALIDQSGKHLQSGHSLIPVLNTVPGVSAEERSPGSYRLSLRGSLLRSPYGVRDIKVYLDEIPLTDAGGNTYLNAIDPAAQDRIVIIKGPDGSLFGPNMGGVVHLLPFAEAEAGVAGIQEAAESEAGRTAALQTGAGHGAASAPGLSRLSSGLSLGSYDNIREYAHYTFRSPRHSLSLKQGYHHDGGYRSQSRMRRHYLQLSEAWKWHTRHQLKILALASDLQYETPGGLTLSQMRDNPRSARPATSTLLGAEAQQTGVHTRLLLLGLTQHTQLTGSLKNVSSVFGNAVDFKNPFITNYETRAERTIGAKSYFEWQLPGNLLSSRFHVGLEAQQTRSLVKNFDNLGGKKGSLQQADRLQAVQSFAFLRYTAAWQNLSLELALSRNSYQLRFKERHPISESSFSRRQFDPQWMPKVSMTYRVFAELLLRAGISRGYAPPTTAEIRPAGNRINTALEASKGWNYEAGLRYRGNSSRFVADFSVYHFQMQEAIVRRVLPGETEHYVNAGGTDQLGLEAVASWWIIPKLKSGLLRGLQLKEAVTLNRFLFRDYRVDNAIYSGNRLSGVPNERFVSVLEVYLLDFSLLLEHRYTSELPLNDGNTAWADPFHLLFARLEWPTTILKRPVTFFAWGANLLNTRYSAGHDLNAFGARYYNPAPGRNFSLGFSFSL